jgi:ZIP family zinc transporter
MLTAIIFGAISAASLFVGACIGDFWKLKSKVVAAIMAFGAGVLIYALTFGLVEESYAQDGLVSTAVGFLVGSVVFILGDYLIHAGGGRKHRNYQTFKPVNTSNGKAITMGAIFDTIPESVALGIAIAEGRSVGVLLLFAIVFNNFPEAMSSVPGLKKEGYPKMKIFWLWAIVALFTLLLTMFSYQYLSGLDRTALAFIESFAAGAILAMLSTSIMPEAYQEGGIFVSALTTTGFLISFVISRI